MPNFGAEAELSYYFGDFSLKRFLRCVKLSTSGKVFR